MNYIFRSEYREIVIYLNGRIGQYVSSEELANIIGFSSKTTAKFIRDINILLEDFECEIISKTGYGFKIHVDNQDAYNDFLNKYIYIKSYEINENVQIVHYLIREFLTKENLKSSFFEERLYTTRGTINKYYNDIHAIAKTFNARFVSNSSKGCNIEAREHDLRCFINYELFYYQNSHLEISEFYGQVYSNTDVNKKISNLIIEIQKKFQGTLLDDTSISELASAIYIAHVRNSIGKKLVYDDDIVERFVKRNSYYLALEIVETVREKLDFKLEENDIIYIAIYIVANRTFVNKENFPLSEGYLDCQKLSIELTNYLHKINNFKYLAKDDRFIDDLSLNLTQIVTQSEFSLYRASQTHNETKSLQATLLAVQCAVFIYNKYKFKINQNQIDYLSTLIYPYFGRYPFDIKANKALLISDINKSIGKGIAERLMRNYGTHLESLEIINLYELNEINVEEYSFVFSSYERSRFKQLPPSVTYIYVDTFFNLTEKSVIREKLLSRNNEIHKSYISYFKRLNIVELEKCNTKEKFLLEMQKHLCEENVESTIEQIKLYAAFSDFPKKNQTVFITPLESKTSCPSITVFILDRQVSWDDEKVRYVVYWDRGNNIEDSSYFENESIPNILYNVFTNNTVTQNLLKPNAEQIITERAFELYDYIIGSASSFK